MKNKEEQDYCLVSKEILLFIEWILIYDAKLLQSLIKKAWKNGFEKLYFEEFNKKEKLDELDPQQTILDFFYVLENSITILAKKGINKKNEDMKKILGSDLSISFDNYNDYQKTIELSLLKYVEEKKKLSETEQVSLKNEMKNTFYKHFLENWDGENSLIE